MVVGSLFSGAGLLDKGLHDAGISHAWFVEREPERRELLGRRWPGVPVFDDVRTVGGRDAAAADAAPSGRPEGAAADQSGGLGGDLGAGGKRHRLKPVDAIVGGFPCKGASNAGPRTGFDHPETALWAEFARIVRELRPRYVAVENVAAIRSLHSGAVWGTVLGDLAALGYDMAWGCVRASDVEAPHGRDRIFAVARLASDADRTHGQGHGGAERVRAQVARIDGYHLGVVADPSGSRTSASQLSRQLRGAEQDAAGVAVEWGAYEPAIRRWEAIHGAAPAPLTRLRGLDDGDAKLHRLRARMDRQRLSALGDGVHVYVGRLLGDALMALHEADTYLPRQEMVA